MTAEERRKLWHAMLDLRISGYVLGRADAEHLGGVAAQDKDNEALDRAKQLLDKLQSDN